MVDKAEEVIKRRQREYIRDSLIAIFVIAALVTGIVFAIKFLKGKTASIALYDENGEELGSYSEGADVQIPTKKGYSVSCVSESGETYDTLQAALSSGETSVKQVFSPIEYTLTLYLTGGALEDNLGYERHTATEGQEELGDYYTRTYTIEDEAFELPAVTVNTLASKRGCTFAFWSNVNYIGKNYSVDNLKSTEIKNVETDNTRDIVFYAVWKDVMCTVNVIDVHGGLLFFESYKETSLLSEEELTQKAIDASPVGFVFDGFYSDSHLHIPFDFTTEVNQKIMTIYTKWIPQPFNLTFKDLNGDTLDTVVFKADQEIVFYDYTAKLAPGKMLVGWSLNDEPFEATLMPAKDITLYPILEDIPYTIIWYVDDERNEEQIYYYGNEPQAPSTLNTDKKEDEAHTYVFDGWDPVLTSVTEDKTYTAQYRTINKKFTYSFEVDGAEYGSPTTVDYDTDIVFPTDPLTFEKEGYEYTFIKWVIKGTDITPTKITEDMVIEAKLSSHICSYEITWVDRNNVTIPVYDEDNNLVDSLTLDYGTVIDLGYGYTDSLASYTAEVGGKNRTFTFKGWSINNIFQNSNSYTITGNTTIKATYETDGDKFTYVLKTENGDVIVEDKYYVEEEYDLYLYLYNDITRTKESDETYSYTFDGWYYDDNGIPTKLESSIPLKVGKNGTIVLKEHFTPTYIPYTITWDLNNGTTPVEIDTYHYGEELHPETDLGATPTKDSTKSTIYTFSGWNYTSNVVTKSTTYTAQYTEQTRQYTYTFYNGEDVVKTNKIDYHAVIIAPIDPTKAATAQYTYTFAGWYENPDCSGPIFTAGDVIEDDINYYAKFNETVNKYTYTFYMDDEETVVSTSTEDYGSTVTKPSPNPSKAQDDQYTYEFAGWETFDGVAYVDNKELVCDVSYRAIFTPVLRSYTYTLYNESSELESHTVTYGTVITIADIATPTKAEDAKKYTFSFAAWYLNSDLSGDPVGETITITGDVDLYAKFTATPILHTITFVTGTGASTIDPIQVGYGLPITAPQNPTKPHYTFDGWDDVIPATMGTEDLEFTAQWEAIEYTITYNLHGGSATNNITKYTAETPDEELVLKIDDDSTKIGYTLAGWKYNNTVITSIKDTNVIDNITIDAYFEANTYTITYDVVKEDVTIAHNTKTVTYLQSYGTLDTPSKHGYIFEGWYSDSSYTEQSRITASSVVTITADQTLYAKWSLTPYYVHGYLGDTKVAEFYFDIENPVTLTAYTNNGEYDFEDWYKESDFSGTPVTSYSNTTGANITIVYALVKTHGLTIAGNTVTEYDGTSVNVLIPRKWNGTNVTIIGSGAFMDNDTLESIDAPFITEIQESAFEGCMNLEDIDLSNVITVGNKAFLGCSSITSVDLSSATSIGEKAFIYSGVEEITLNNALVTPLGSYAFGQCNITVIHYSGDPSTFNDLVANKGNGNLTWTLVQP